MDLNRIRELAGLLETSGISPDLISVSTLDVMPVVRNAKWHKKDKRDKNWKKLKRLQTLAGIVGDENEYS